MVAFARLRRSVAFARLRRSVASTRLRRSVASTRLRRSVASTRLRAMLTGIAQARTLGLAAEMSFWLFLSLVPLAAVAGWLAARVATSDGLTSSMLATVPYEVKQLLEGQVRHVAAWHGSTVAPLAAGTFVWLAASGVHAVFDALEVQSGTSRPWWKKRVLSIATCMALAVGTRPHRAHSGIRARLGGPTRGWRTLPANPLPPAPPWAGIQTFFGWLWRDSLPWP